MKILILKHYNHAQQYVYNYGDDMDEIFHSARFIEEAMEVDAARLTEIREAVSHFNQKQSLSRSKVSLEVVEIIDVAQTSGLIDEMLRDHKAAEDDRKKEERERRERNAKAAVAKREKALKKLARESGISLDELKALGTKK